MKKLIAIIAIALPLALSTRAQYIVYDPTMNIQQIIDEAESIAKYVQMIDNQVQQIQTLTQQLNQFEHYEALFGDPSKVVLSMVAPLSADLQSVEPGLNLENLVANADGNIALTYNDSGIYSTVGTSFQTPRGQTIQRPANQYKAFSAVINSASNYVAVADNAAKRRASIKNQIAQTTQQLQNATTDAEVQKLQGVLSSLNGDLASTDDELNQAADSALVQDIQNRNDQQKQIQALTEQKNAEFTEAVSNYTAKFQLLNQPVAFPTP
ncbi:MAG TPA: type IV secretion system protein [Verrucomicrobiae bacterium]|nr:type IV secretion system protein [Verrucomicrobiae bacterium]